MDFDVKVSLGRVPGVSDFRKFGYNDSLERSPGYIGPTEEPWLPDTTSILEVVSDSIEDAPGGTGADKVQLLGLDANYREKEELLAMNGMTSVPSVLAYLRFNRSFIVQTADNVGTITISAGGIVVGAIGPGKGQTQISGFTVPRRKTLLITGVNTVVNSTNPVDLIFWQSIGAKRLVQQYNGLRLDTSFPYKPPLPFEQRTDLWFTGQLKSGVATASAEYVGYLAR